MLLPLSSIITHPKSLDRGACVFGEGVTGEGLRRETKWRETKKQKRLYYLLARTYKYKLNLYNIVSICLHGLIVLDIRQFDGFDICFGGSLSTRPSGIWGGGLDN
jgi:hypothetical protein